MGHYYILGVVIGYMQRVIEGYHGLLWVIEGYNGLLWVIEGYNGLLWVVAVIDCGFIYRFIYRYKT